MYVVNDKVIEMKCERIELRIKPERSAEAAALEKIRNYDRHKYISMSDYIIHAVNAYEEPLQILPDVFLDELRKMLHEELSRDKQDHFL